MADPREIQFQKDVIAGLETQGWLAGASDCYDKARALYPEDVVAFVSESFPDQWERFQKRYPRNSEAALLDSVARKLDDRGALDVLRHGFKDRGAKVRLAQFRPDHALNPDVTRRYGLNRLRVVPEVTYSPHGAPGRLDLVLFLNGIPTATLELKSVFRQAVEVAKRQYREDRPPVDPTCGKPEPLLSFKRGALVHFAVSQAEVFMTTNLEGVDTRFLPFNRGLEDGSAGNPPNPDGYDTSYLWEEVLAPANWLQIVGRFVHLERTTELDERGRKVVKESMIFPRYHQWDVVTKLVDAARTEGAGQRYLVQHSAGSGKSNSIAWTAHQLASLYSAEGEKLFRSVIVVTDRTVLDDQLQETIYQFEHRGGVVARVNREEGEGSKSQQLADALEAGTPIIIVTLQTFPHVLEAVQERTTLKDKRFAVVADEAHSSQTGRTAVKLRQVLVSEQLEEDEELTGEDVLNALLEARKQAGTISYFAFTATPKGKTLELFGRPPDPSQPIGDNNKPEAFHVYSMRQAIEEGFILDVLRNYTPYDLAYRLGQKNVMEDVEVPGRRAGRELAQWMRLHPHNISQKVTVIVEHFRTRVLPLLGGKAKAMVVTSGRKDAVRYKLAIDAYVRDNEITGVNALVAFSGDVDEALAALEGYDLALAGKQSKEAEGGVAFNERTMNPRARGDLREVFDKEGFNVLVVANKFQTGFDQPKLVAMYVDKKLSGVDAVQTLSRLNRTFQGKRQDDVFVLDFVNDPEEIKRAFAPYYRTTLLAETSEPNLVYDLFEKLRDARIYEWHEVEAFAEAFFDPRGLQSSLLAYCRPAADRYRSRLKAASQWRRRARDAEDQALARKDEVAAENARLEQREAGEELDSLETFRSDLRGFLRFYEFMSQVIDFDDADLERMSVFGRNLLPMLPRDPEDELSVDLSNVQLTAYRLSKQRQREIHLDGDEGVKGVTSVGTGTAREDEDVWLSQLLEKLNEIFGSDLTNDDLLSYADTIRRKVEDNERVMQQVRNNPPAQVMLGDFPQAVVDAVLESGSAHESLMRRVLDDKPTAERFARLLLDMILKGNRPSLPDDTE